ncbi:hypothetical protein PybrP1_000735 [[Pythium] brassicae (nom. inval.)]|nr:hypothetical protein PybrP1_000735 [[Pythium] brassicae (nom. inval.)]
MKFPLSENRRQLSKLKWKLLKKRDSITVYSERSARGASAARPALSKSVSVTDLTASGSGSAFDFTASGSALDFTESGRSRMVFTSPVSRVSATAAMAASGQRKLPKLLAVGTVSGTVEDMVYGLSSPTPTHAMIKAAYLQDDTLDAKMLYEIRSPTPDDPLRSLGLKWLVKGHSSAMSTLVRPRDFVFVESVGVKTRASGERVGYVVTHSVDLSECRELAELSIVRARISSCSLFRQSVGHVDVYMKSYAEPNGNVPDSVALRAAANSLVGVAQAESCAHSRKMGWEVTQMLRDPARRARGAPIVTSDSSCSTCAKSFSRFSAAFTCLFCASLVCAKCREQRELTVPLPSTKTQAARSAKRVTRTAVDGCKRCCATTFRYQDAAEVAKQEILAGEYGRVPATQQQHSGSSGPAALPGSPHGHRAAETSPRGQSASKAARAAAGASMLPPAAFSNRVSLEDISAHLLALDTMPAKYTSPSGSQRGPRAISLDDLAVSDLTIEDLEELEDLLAQPSSTSSTLSADDLAAPVKPLSADREAGLERKDSVIELKRDDGEWLPSTSNGRAGVGASQPKSDNLYQRITELHQTAESLYHYTKRATETVLSASVATGPSLLSSLALESE